MTRREKHMTMLDLVENYLLGDDSLSADEILDGVRFARGRADAPGWWAEVVYELRAQRREDREQVRHG